jgi:predicted house-cleaning NTP pyrophosphatase (Maf/HAM1 superfamily)
LSFSFHPEADVVSPAAAFTAVAWHVKTEVEFAPLREAVIRSYIATGEPMYVNAS